MAASRGGDSDSASSWRQTSALAELVREELAKEVPEQDYDFAQPIQMRFNEMLEGSRADLAVRIFGDDYDTMEKVAGQVKEILEGIAGTDNAEFESQGRVPVLEIRVVDDDGHDVPDGVPGELVTRGPYTIRGYYDSPEVNATSFTADGFYKMGDVVRLVEEVTALMAPRTSFFTAIVAFSMFEAPRLRR